MSKVLLINGSPHPKGCTWAALDEMIRVFESEETYGYPEVESGVFTNFMDGK